jgi:hypothetical protein
MNFTVGYSNNFDSNDYFIGNYSYDICWGQASGIFGDYNCDASLDLMKSVAYFIKSHSIPLNVNFIIWTG